MISFPILRLALICFLVITAILSIASQTPPATAKSLYEEVTNYVKTRTAEYTASGKNPSREVQVAIETMSKSLAGKYAATIASETNLSKDDLPYLALLWDLAGEDDKALETYRKFLEQPGADATGGVIQYARKRVVAYSAKKKEFPEMEATFYAWVNGKPVEAIDRISLESNMASAYYSDKKYDQAIKYGKSAYDQLKSLENKSATERNRKNGYYGPILEALTLSYQEVNRKDEALGLLAEGCARAFATPSSALYGKVMEIARKAGVSQKKLMEKLGSSSSDANAAPEFAVKQWIGQEPANLASLRGRVVLLDFWATWCGPCISTFPRLRDLHNKYGPKGFTIVGVTRFYGEAGKRKVDEIEELAFIREFKEKHKLPYGIAVTGADTSTKYGVPAIPATFLLDKKGVVRYIGVGSSAEEAGNLEEMIKKVLAEQ